MKLYHRGRWEIQENLPLSCFRWVTDSYFACLRLILVGMILTALWLLDACFWDVKMELDGTWMACARGTGAWFPVVITAYCLRIFVALCACNFGIQPSQWAHWVHLHKLWMSCIFRYHSVHWMKTNLNQGLVIWAFLSSIFCLRRSRMTLVQ